MISCENLNNILNSDKKISIGIYNKMENNIKYQDSISSEEKELIKKLIVKDIDLFERNMCFTENNFSYYLNKPRINIFESTNIYKLYYNFNRLTQTIADFKKEKSIDDDLYTDIEVIDLEKILQSDCESGLTDLDLEPKETVPNIILSHSAEHSITIKIDKGTNYLYIAENTQSRTLDYIIKGSGSFGTVISINNYNLSIKCFKDKESAIYEIEIVNKLNKICNIIEAYGIKLKNNFMLIDTKSYDENIILMKYADNNLKDFFDKNTLSHSSILTIILNIAKMLLCLYNKHFVYCDLKLLNLLYKCKDNKTIRIYFGDLGSIIEKTDNITEITSEYRDPSYFFDSSTRYGTLSKLYSKYITANTYSPPELKEFLKKFFYEKKINIHEIYTQEYMTWSIGILIYYICTKKGSLHNSYMQETYYIDINNDNINIKINKMKEEVLNSNIDNKNIFYFMFINLIKIDPNERWNLNDLINFIEIINKNNTLTDFYSDNKDMISELNAELLTDFKTISKSLLDNTKENKENFKILKFFKNKLNIYLVDFMNQDDKWIMIDMIAKLLEYNKNNKQNFILIIQNSELRVDDLLKNIIYINLYKFLSFEVKLPNLFDHIISNKEFIIENNIELDKTNYKYNKLIKRIIFNTKKDKIVLYLLNLNGDSKHTSQSIKRLQDLDALNKMIKNEKDEKFIILGNMRIIDKDDYTDITYNILLDILNYQDFSSTNFNKFKEESPTLVDSLSYLPKDLRYTKTDFFIRTNYIKYTENLKDKFIYSNILDVDLSNPVIKIPSYITLPIYSLCDLDLIDTWFNISYSDIDYKYICDHYNYLYEYNRKGKPDIYKGNILFSGYKQDKINMTVLKCAYDIKHMNNITTSEQKDKYLNIYELSLESSNKQLPKYLAFQEYNADILHFNDYYNWPSGSNLIDYMINELYTSAILRYLNINALRYNLIYTVDQIYLESIELNSNQYTEFSTINKSVYINKLSVLKDLAFAYFSIAFLQMGDFIGADLGMAGYKSACNNIGSYTGKILFQDIGSGGLYTMTRGLINTNIYNNLENLTEEKRQQIKNQQYYDTLITGYTYAEKNNLSCKKEFIHNMLINEEKIKYENLKKGIRNVLSKNNFNDLLKQLENIYNTIDDKHVVLKGHFEVFTENFIDYFNSRLDFLKKESNFNSSNDKGVNFFINKMIDAYNSLPLEQRNDTQLATLE